MKEIYSHRSKFGAVFSIIMLIAAECLTAFSTWMCFVSDSASIDRDLNPWVFYLLIYPLSFLGNALILYVIVSLICRTKTLLYEHKPVIIYDDEHFTVFLSYGYKTFRWSDIKYFETYYYKDNQFIRFKLKNRLFRCEFSTKGLNEDAETLCKELNLMALNSN